MKENTVDYISRNLNNFSKRQRKIAEFIIGNYDRASYMTAAKIAEEVGVSESTVVRFAYGLGFEGYQLFQNTLREAAKSQMTSMQRMEIVSQRIDENNILRDVLKSDIDKIEKTLLEIDPEQFNRCVEALISARNVYILGVRSSASLASFTGFYFNLLFDNVKHIRSQVAEDILEQLLRVDRGDVVFGISFPRYSNSIIKALAFAHRRGAQIIALTDSVHSPIVEYASCSLYARSDMDSFADSLVAPMSLLNALIFAVGRKKKREVACVFDELESIWDEYEVYDKERNL